MGAPLSTMTVNNGEEGDLHAFFDSKILNYQVGVLHGGPDANIGDDPCRKTLNCKGKKSHFEDVSRLELVALLGEQLVEH
jgi:hypothetical protein